MDKINENTASTYLANQYGEIKAEIDELSTRRNYAGVFQAIVNHINLLLSNGQTKKVAIKIRPIGWLYKRGNEYIQYIIENLFVRSFEGMKRRCTSEQWNAVYQLIPTNLRNVYQQQIQNYPI